MRTIEINGNLGISRKNCRQANISTTSHLSNYNNSSLISLPVLAEHHKHFHIYDRQVWKGINAKSCPHARPRPVINAIAAYSDTSQ
jgi:hypothetical protein